MGSNYRWVPILQGKRLNYHDYFALTGSTVAFVLAFISFVLNLIFRKLASIKQHQSEGERQGGQSTYRFVTNSHVNQSTSQLEMASYASAHNIYSTNQVNNNRLLYNQANQMNNSNEGSIKYSKDCLIRTADFFYSATYFFLTICPLVLGAFQVVWTSASIAMMVGIYVIKYLVDIATPDHIHSYDNQTQQNQTIVVNNTPSKKTIIASLLYSIIVPLFFHNTCLAFYNDNIGYYNTALGFTVNTQFTRIFQLNDFCPPGPPCHLYATVPENTANDVFINVHTNKDTRNVTIYYDTEDFHLNNTSAKLRYSQQSSLFDLYYVEAKGQRNVHSALLQGLQPKTKYVIQVKYDGDDSVQATHYYKTLPDKNDPNLNITMINAGDAGNTEPARNFNKLVSTLQPDIFFMGGDIAYDDNFNTCYYVWDFYLSELENMFSTLGYLLPMVWTVGNHDVGLNELPLVNVTLTDTVGPAYLTYFPQHYERDENFTIVKAVPQLVNRRTVFHHDVANSVYLSLDSGYLHDFSGWQESYIMNTLQNSPNTFKFANYHVPIYSACGSVDEEDSTPIVRALFHWVPRFDQFRMATVYENHVHTFKRTYPMVGNRVVEKDGTVYLGDGAYGAIPFYCKLNKKLDIFAKAACINNFWVTQITQDSLSHRAYNKEGDVMDSYVQDGAYYREL